MNNAAKSKIASLTFRGFEVSPHVIEEMLSVKASEAGERGTHVRAGVAALLKRSFARFSIELAPDCRLDQAVPVLLAHAGGLQRLKSVRDVVTPEFLELDITWPVKGSDEQEGGFLPVAVLSDLANLECSLSFGFT